jgi:hypothetical protein
VPKSIVCLKPAFFRASFLGQRKHGCHFHFHSLFVYPLIWWNSESVFSVPTHRADSLQSYFIYYFTHLGIGTLYYDLRLSSKQLNILKLKIYTYLWLFEAVWTLNHLYLPNRRHRIHRVYIRISLGSLISISHAAWCAGGLRFRALKLFYGPISRYATADLI